MISKENEEKQERDEAEFKNRLFAHGVMSGRPDLYWELYPQEHGLSEEAESELEWQRPETLMDAEQMLAELRETGWGQD